MFGESALQNKAKRNASIVALEDCQVLQLMKDDYDEIIDDVAKVEKSRNLDFLRSMRFLFDWGFEKIQKFNNEIGIKTFKDGEYVFKQGSEGREAFIVLEGKLNVECILKVETL